MGKASDLSRLDRYKSYARSHVGRSPSNHGNSSPGGSTILPFHSKSTSNAGGLDAQDGRGSPSGSGAGKRVLAGGDGPISTTNGGLGLPGSSAETSTRNEAEDYISHTDPSPAPPPIKSENACTGIPPVTSVDGAANTGAEKPKLTSRMLAGTNRFGVHTKNALFHSWINVLLIFVPVGIVVEAIGLSPTIVFAMNAVAIVPLAGLLSFATESVASRMGDTLGALLNVSFGNAVELIIFIIALVKNEIRIVQASLLGSILANLLLILGMAFLFGGLRFREQIYNSTVTQMSACLLSLSVMSLLLPVSPFVDQDRGHG